jgi:hypothetical protein
MDREGVGTISCDRLEDGIGAFCPNERFWIVVMGLDEGGDVGLEILDAAMDAAFDLLVGEQREPAFDLVQPGGAGRREVEVVARVVGKPRGHRRRLVSGAIVEHQMDVEIGWHDLLDRGQELAEFDRAVALVTAADDLAGGDVQSGEQRGRAVTLVVAAPLDLTRSYRQQRLGAVERWVPTRASQDGGRLAQDAPSRPAQGRLAIHWRGWCPQPGDQHQDFPEHLPRHRDLGHLERDVAAMADDLRADLDQLLVQAGQRPRLRRLYGRVGVVLLVSAQCMVFREYLL